MKIFAILSMLLLLAGNSLAADTTAIDGILAPVNKIYDLLKAVVSVAGIIALTAAGAMYMFSGSNIQTRENAKMMVSYAVVGLVLVWVAPLIVGYLTAPSI